MSIIETLEAFKSDIATLEQRAKDAQAERDESVKEHANTLARLATAERERDAALNRADAFEAQIGVVLNALGVGVSADGERLASTPENEERVVAWPALDGDFLAQEELEHTREIISALDSAAPKSVMVDDIIRDAMGWGRMMSTERAERIIERLSMLYPYAIEEAQAGDYRAVAPLAPRDAEGDLPDDISVVETDWEALLSDLNAKIKSGDVVAMPEPGTEPAPKPKRRRKQAASAPAPAPAPASEGLNDMMAAIARVTGQTANLSAKPAPKVEAVPIAEPIAEPITLGDTLASFTVRGIPGGNDRRWEIVAPYPNRVLAYSRRWQSDDKGDWGSAQAYKIDDLYSAPPIVPAILAAQRDGKLPVGYIVDQDGDGAILLSLSRFLSSVLELFYTAQGLGYAKGNQSLRLAMLGRYDSFTGMYSGKGLASKLSAVIEQSDKPLNWCVRTLDLRVPDPEPEGGEPLDQTEAETEAPVAPEPTEAAPAPAEPSDDASDCEQVAVVDFNKGDPDAYALVLDYFPFFGEYSLRRSTPPLPGFDHWITEDEWTGSLEHVLSSVSADEARAVSGAMKTQAEASSLAPAEPPMSETDAMRKEVLALPTMPEGFPAWDYSKSHSEMGRIRTKWIDENLLLARSKQKKPIERARCQICGRALEANNGIVRDHGHTVKDGWNDGACFGSGVMPYQLDFNALVASISGEIPNIIDAELRHIENIKNNIVREYSKASGWETTTPESYAKRQWDHRPWEDFKLYHIGLAERRIERLRKTREDHKERLAKWKPEPFLHLGTPKANAA